MRFLPILLLLACDPAGGQIDLATNDQALDQLMGRVQALEDLADDQAAELAELAALPAMLDDQAAELAELRAITDAQGAELASVQAQLDTLEARIEALERP